ncbi:MAG: C39 family peptidase, partial [Eggerthellaceae bacterium]|nr:C39 family peptidase [Eggerthellaceae bacterium]
TNKMMKLAVEDPEAIDYVVDFIDKYPQEKAQPYTEAVTKGVVPHLYQWDERWAYITYSSTTFGCTGCGPTSMLMVYMGVTGKNDMSPGDMAERAATDGYETDYEGTMNQYFVNEAADLGMDVIELDINSDSLTWALESGMPVICNVGPGDFTLYGHFFVITGLNDDGTLTINDPFSSVRSSETWDMDLVLNQTVALYAYSLAGSSNTSDDSSSDSNSSSSTESDLGTTV